MELFRKTPSSQAILVLSLYSLALGLAYPAFSAPVSQPGSGTHEPSQDIKARLAANYGKLPLSFEPNQGQSPAVVRFLSRGTGYTLFLTPHEAVMTLGRPDALQQEVPRQSKRKTPNTTHARVLRMKLVGANPHPVIAGADELPGKCNYLIGSDPKQWQTSIANYGRVHYAGVYPGIDLSFYGNQRQLEYDWIVAPGAEPSRIRMSFEGCQALRVDERGNLSARLGERAMVWQKPLVYQKVNGKHRLVDGHFVVRGRNRVGFKVASYDRRIPLVIDPVLSYSTYLGGSNEDFGRAIVVDAAGNAYITGQTHSPIFPTTPGAFQTSYTPTAASDDDAFVTKINPAGTALIYSTFLGASTGAFGSAGEGIAVDGAGHSYVTGETSSASFPTTPGAFQTSPTGNQAFVTELNLSGSGLIYSTLLGAANSASSRAIAVDAAGSAYITGSAGLNFPTTPGAFQTGYSSPSGGHAFVTKLNPSGTGLVYSTYLGGNNLDDGRAIAVDAAGSAYVTGLTFSSNFPTTRGAFQTVFYGGGAFAGDAFVTKLNAAGTALVYSTFLSGTGGAGGQGIVVDGAGNAYVAGFAHSGDFPTTPGAFQSGIPNTNAFVTKLNPSGSGLVYSTLLGGSNNGDAGLGIAIDGAGRAYVTGQTYASDFPTTPGAFQTSFKGGPNGSSAFFTELNPTGSALVYSTYLGGSGVDSGNGIALDGAGGVYLAGDATSTDFPVTPGAFQPSTTAGPGGYAAFVAKIQLSASITTSPATGITTTTATLNGAVNPNGVDSTAQFQWGLTTAYGSTTGPVTALVLGVPLNLQSPLTGLTPSTTYHYRATAVNSFGSVNGSDVSFTTAALPPPSTATGSASTVTTTTATMNGTVNPHGLDTSYQFQWGLSSNYGASTPFADAGSGAATVNVLASLVGLTPNTTYHYRIVATNAGGTTTGVDSTFETAALPAPTVTTGSATAVITPTATLNGTVNPRGLDTTYQFQWGTTTNYGSLTPVADAGRGTVPTNVSANLTGLTPRTIYHFRLTATNASGTTTGTDSAFAAPAYPPLTAVSGDATVITATAATLNGTVNPNGVDTSYQFEYGATTGYGSSTPPVDLGSSTGPINVSASLPGLAPNTIYHYRIDATNAGGSVNGSDMTFTTSASTGNSLSNTFSGVGWHLISAPVEFDQSFTALGLRTFAYILPPQYVVTPTAPADSFHLGIGYWLLIKADAPSVTVSGTGSAADTTQPFTINLLDDWNIIGNPFNQSIPLSSIIYVDNTGARFPIATAFAQHLLGGGALFTDTDGAGYKTLTAPTDTLNPWDGAWVKAKQAGTKLLIFPNGVPAS